MAQDSKEPNWKDIAYELASLLDDIQLQFDCDMDDRGRNFVKETPRAKFLIKKFIAAQKHFVRYKNNLLYIDDYKIQVEKDKLHTASLMESFKIKP